MQPEQSVRERLLVRELIEGLQAETGEDLYMEMVDGLRAVTAGVLRTGKGGSVSLKFTVKAVRFKGKDGWAAGQVDAGIQVNTKVPEEKRERERPRRFFVLEDGSLSVDDPQQKMFDS